jgi:CheY-like chemotaxis protein
LTGKSEGAKSVVAHVLVVDDDEFIRQSMRAILEEIAGHTVDEAADGVQGLEVLRASKARLVVILDLLMPGLDGIGVLRAVAAETELATRHAFILATVNSKDPHELLHDIPWAVMLLPKPYDLDDLLNVVSVAAEGLNNECNPAQDKV